MDRLVRLTLTAVVVAVSVAFAGVAFGAAPGEWDGPWRESGAITSTHFVTPLMPDTDRPVNVNACYKLDDPDGYDDHTFTGVMLPDGTVEDITVEFTWYQYPAGSGNYYMDFEVQGPFVAKNVYAKGSNTFNWYAFGDGVKSDTGLTCPALDSNGKYPQFSHVSFCFDRAPKVEKNWVFTAPYDFADRGYSYSAWYKDGDDWVEVPLADSDMDGVWTAKTMHDPDSTIEFKWTVMDGDALVFESAVDSEILEGAGPFTNPFALALKYWVAEPPAILLELPGITYTGYYRMAGSDDEWTAVELLDPDMDGVYDAETIFVDETEIEWYGEIVGTIGDVVYYRYKGGTKTEVITGRDKVQNDITVGIGPKAWRLTTCAPAPGATFYAAWSVDKVTWFEVPLVQSAEFPCLWTADSSIPDGMTFYYKWYGKTAAGVEFWSAGPWNKTETMTSAGLVNEYEYFGDPRTIGYWMNWRNHFTQQVMQSIVASVNASSVVFRSNGDAGYYLLTTGSGAKRVASTDVTVYLQEANAKEMWRMLRAQLLGLELNVNVVAAGATTYDGTIVGLSPSAKVYLCKVAGYDNAMVNPWYGDDDVTVAEVISVIEANAARNWSGWSRAKQGFAKDVCDYINNDGDGSAKDIGILQPCP